MISKVLDLKAFWSNVVQAVGGTDIEEHPHVWSQFRTVAQNSLTEVFLKDGRVYFTFRFTAL